MEVPFATLGIGERFRPVGASIAETWVKIDVNPRGMNARALHSGQERLFDDETPVTLLHQLGKTGAKRDLGIG